jgi:hypothetical protein
MQASSQPPVYILIATVCLATTEREKKVGPQGTREKKDVDAI